MKNDEQYRTTNSTEPITAPEPEHIWQGRAPRNNPSGERSRRFHTPIYYRRISMMTQPSNHSPRAHGNRANGNRTNGNRANGGRVSIRMPNAARQKTPVHSAIPCLVLLILATIIPGGSVYSQGGDTVRPILPLYGFDSTEFFIGANSTKWGTANYNPALGHKQSFSVSNIWPFMKAMEFDVLLTAANLDQWNLMHNSPARDSTQKVLVMAGRSGRFFYSGYGREAQFYPFDSIETPFYRSEFATKTGGSAGTTYNIAEIDPNNPEGILQEREYESSNASAGDTILQHVAYYYNPATQTSRSQQDASDFIGFIGQRGDIIGANAKTVYTAVTGHLTDSLSSAVDADSILRIELWQEIPNGTDYLHYTGSGYQTLTATADTALLIDAYNVTKGEYRSGSPTIPINRYRTVEHAHDLRMRIDGGPGPLHHLQPAGASKRLDIKVIWTGVEKVALRNVAIRDSLGQLALGNDSSYRDTLRKAITRKLEEHGYSVAEEIAQYAPEAYQERVARTLRLLALDMQQQWEANRNSNRQR